VITRKQLLFSRDNEKIKSWSRDNKKKKYIPWPLGAYKTTCHFRFSESCTYLKM